MTIAQPDFLLVPPSSGSSTTVTNYGSQATSYVIGAGTNVTHWEYTTGPYSAGGALMLKVDNGANMPRMTTAATAPGTANDSMNFSCGFRIDSWSGANGAEYLCEGGSDGYIKVWLTESGGTYSIIVRADSSTAGWSQTTIATGLAASTYHQVSVRVDLSTVTAGVLHYKVNSGSVTQIGTSQNFSGGSLANAWPQINKENGQNQFGGFVGRLAYWVYDRTSTPWATTDMDSIHSDPVTAFGTWWPGGGGQPAGKRFGGIPFSANSRKGVWRERASGLLVPAWPKPVTAKLAA